MEIKAFSADRKAPLSAKFILLGAISLTLFLLSANQPVYAALYKCTDSNGRVEYRAIRLHDGTCIDMKAPPKPPENPEEAMQKLRNKVDELNKEKAEREKEEQRAAYCKVARDNLEILESQGEVISTNSEGEKTKLNQDQRAAALEQTLKDIDYFCN